ncbi:MAG: YmdB family metallophosphoesterase [Clostridia bacterium]|nr:YmdB family metallophosphoesterase [Clostridia bacterium]MBQ9774356.1 YmdB family metallophosphoesterase [Clostridia bacterium]
MRILAIGDIVGTETVLHLQKHLWSVRSREKIDFVVANGENTSEIRGLCARDASALLDTGIDLITLGNHAFGCRDLYPFLDEHTDTIIRPANFPATSPGSGYTVVTVGGWRVLCMAVSGRIFLDPLACPFETVEKILSREAGGYDLALLDIHGEATSEKLAIAHVFDGRVTVMFGTHTHVPTADEQVLPHGSGYITDLGMSGPVNGIIGTDKEDVINRFRTQMPTRFRVANGKIQANGAIFDVDENAKRVRSVKRITF